MSFTRLPLHVDTRSRINQFRPRGESYDCFLNKLMDLLEKENTGYRTIRGSDILRRDK